MDEAAYFLEHVEPMDSDFAWPEEECARHGGAARERAGERARLHRCARRAHPKRR